MSLYANFIITIFFSLAVMAGGVSYAAHIQAAEEADAQFVRTADAQLDRVEDIIAAYFRAGELAVKTLAALPEARETPLAQAEANAEGAAAPADTVLTDSALSARLAAIRAIVPGVETAFCAYRNGTFLVSPESAAAREPDPRISSWYSDAAWGGGETAITGVHISESSKGPAVTVAARIGGDSGETLGVAGLEISLASLVDTLRDLRMGRTGYLVLFDVEGRVLLDPTAQENLMLAAGATGDAALAALAEASPGMQAVRRGGATLAAFSRVFAASRWKAALVMEKSEQTLPGQSAARLVMLVCAGLCLALAGFGVLFATLFTRPLRALIRQSAALADGNVEALAGIPGRGPDITQLHGDLGRLVGRIMLLLQAEKEKSDALEAQTRKAAALQRKTDKAEQAARDVLLTVRGGAARALSPLALDIAAASARLDERFAAARDAAERRRDAAGGLREAALAMLDDATTYSRQAGETEKNADAAAMAARNGVTLGLDMVRALEIAREALAALPGSLDPLKAGLADIVRTADGVRDLAEQANLLGLNIAIEAASLGEDGKEVSQAAETMRALAERAMTAAASLDGVIASLEHGQAAHSLAVAKSAATAKRALTVAEKAKTAFAAIAAAAVTTAEQVKVLATALEGAALQDKTGRETAESLPRISRETEETLRLLADAVADIAALSARLSLAAQELFTQNR